MRLLLRNSSEGVLPLGLRQSFVHFSNKSCFCSTPLLCTRCPHKQWEREPGCCNPTTTNTNWMSTVQVATICSPRWCPSGEETSAVAQPSPVSCSPCPCCLSHGASQPRNFSSLGGPLLGGRAVGLQNLPRGGGPVEKNFPARVFIYYFLIF